MFNFDAQSYGMKEFQINEQEKKEIKITQNNLSIAAAIILLLCISIVSLTTKDLKQVLTFNLSPLKTNNYTHYNIHLNYLINN